MSKEENKIPEQYSDSTKVAFGIIFVVCLTILGLTVAFAQTWQGVVGALIIVVTPMIACVSAVNSEKWK